MVHRDSAALLISAAGLSILLWWRKKTPEFRRQQSEMEHERRALREQYDYLSKYANDIILLLDEAGSDRGSK